MHRLVQVPLVLSSESAKPGKRALALAYKTTR